jgi:hypothetical protein
MPAAAKATALDQQIADLLTEVKEAKRQSRLAKQRARDAKAQAKQAKKVLKRARKALLEAQRRVEQQTTLSKDALAGDDDRGEERKKDDAAEGRVRSREAAPAPKPRRVRAKERPSAADSAADSATDGVISQPAGPADVSDEE